MEATTLLELSLLKMELKAAKSAWTETAATTASGNDNRETNRIRSSASVIIPNVIAFLYEANLT
jgi:hypothetical protein